MMMPSASMSSSTVMKTNTNAALRTRGTALTSSAAAAFLSCIGIRFLTQRQPDRGSGQVETVAQLVDQIATVGVRPRVGAAAEQYEAWRAAFRLGQVVEPDAPTRYRRWRMRRRHLGEPAVERTRGRALVPHGVGLDHGG